MNLGATCYMASAMQQLYMIPRFRAALLNARVVESTKHEAAFREMQKMFAFLLVCEFCLGKEGQQGSWLADM